MDRTHLAASTPRGLERLLELQDVDTAIDRLTLRREALIGQEGVREARAGLADAESRLGELQLSLDAVAREQRRLENDIDLMDQKIQAERRRELDGSVVNPKELQAMEAEIKSLGGRKSRKEDDLLDQMQQREDLERALGPVAEEVEAARAGLHALMESSSNELVDVENELGQLAARRDSLLPSFDPELLELYEELRGSKKGVGAAALVEGVCQGCHQKLSPVYMDRMKRAGGMRRCEYCRRILIPA